MYFRIWKSFVLILSLSFLKLEMKQTIPFFLGIIKVGAVQLELLLHFNTPMFTNLLSPFFRVSSCTSGIEKGLAWYRLAYSKKLNFVF